MKKTEICPVCGYDPSRDAKKYLALARLSLPGKMCGKPLPRLPKGCRVEYRGN